MGKYREGACFANVILAELQHLTFPASSHGQRWLLQMSCAVHLLFHAFTPSCFTQLPRCHDSMSYSPSAHSPRLGRGRFCLIRTLEAQRTQAARPSYIASEDQVSHPGVTLSSVFSIYPTFASVPPTVPSKRGRMKGFLLRHAWNWGQTISRNLLRLSFYY